MLDAGGCGLLARHVVPGLASASELRPRVPAGTVAEVLAGGPPSDAGALSRAMFEERGMPGEPTRAAHVNPVARTPKNLWAECPPPGFWNDSSGPLAGDLSVPPHVWGTRRPFSFTPTLVLLRYLEQTNKQKNELST